MRFCSADRRYVTLGHAQGGVLLDGQAGGAQAVERPPPGPEEVVKEPGLAEGLKETGNYR
ncbi:hypothetical protein, partial [Pseudomonas aeruginosa]|uniref:hypothetical protein n=1 Tax=Pseudomonas aeruginosa TaxID=287 RepID=UPI0040380F4A